MWAIDPKSGGCGSAISQDGSVLAKLCEKEASADRPWPLCFLLYGAGLLTGSPVYAVRATF